MDTMREGGSPLPPPLLRVCTAIGREKANSGVLSIGHCPAAGGREQWQLAMPSLQLLQKSGHLRDRLACAQDTEVMGPHPPTSWGVWDSPNHTGHLALSRSHLWPRRLPFAVRAWHEPVVVKYKLKTWSLSPVPDRVPQNPWNLLSCVLIPVCGAGGGEEREI